MDTITTADLNAINALAQVADRLPAIINARIEHGTVTLQVYLAADAVAAAYLLGLTDRTMRHADYTSPTGQQHLSTHTRWTLPGQPFTVLHVAIAPLTAEAA